MASLGLLKASERMALKQQEVYIHRSCQSKVRDVTRSQSHLGPQALDHVRKIDRPGRRVPLMILYSSILFGEGLCPMCHFHSLNLSNYVGFLHP